MQISTNGTILNCRLDGPADGPVLVFSNSLATSMAMWDDQVSRLKDRFRILRYDNRGHGGSKPTPGPYTLDLLAGDLVGLLNALEIDRVLFCGLSMGGMIGQWLGINAPERVDRLVLSNTASFFPNKEMWRDRIEMAERDGISAIAEVSIKRWFTPEYLARPESLETIDRVRRFINETNCEGYLACCVAIREMNFSNQLERIKTPTLVIMGEKDPATLPEYGELIARGIKTSKSVVLPEAAHLSNIQQADNFTRILREFLET